MKKAICMLLSIIFSLGLCACALGEGEKRMGELYKPGQSEQESSEQFSAIETGKVLLQLELTYFNNLSSMALALQTGRIDAMSLPYEVARYLMLRSPDLYQYFIDEKAAHFETELCIAMAQGSEVLMDELNAALDSMKVDGTLEALKIDYIDQATQDGEPLPVELPVLEGAQELRVVVTGDLPPLDYVSAEGHSGGYNMVLLAELSRRMNVNFVLIAAEAGSRAETIFSGRADMIFWMRRITSGDGLLISNECPQGLIVSDSYFVSPLVVLEMK